MKTSLHTLHKISNSQIFLPDMASGGILDLGELLKCPICLEIFPGRIHQCKNRHNICAEHVSNLANCPVCRVSYLEGSKG